MLITRYAPLALALLLACVMYTPSIPAGLFGDDYAYLLAEREMGVGEFLDAAIDPTEDDTLLHVPGGYWRPLSALSWQLTAPVLGSDGLFYHVLTLAIHLAAIALLWLLARRIAGGTVGPAAAALVFALHPASIEAVTWASSVNSAALPVALGGWLALTRAVDDDSAHRKRWIWTAVLLLAAALLFRETVAVIAVAASLWYIAVNPPPLRSLTAGAAVRWTWPVVAMALPVVAYLVVSSAFFTRSASGDRTALEFDAVRNWGFYVRYAAVPIGPPQAGLIKALAYLGGGLILLALPAALLARRWVIAALLLGFFVSLIPYSTVDFGTSARYLYFPLALLCLAGAVVLKEIEQAALCRWPAFVRAAPFGLCVVAIPVAAYGYIRVERWVTEHPDEQGAWLDQVTDEWPRWPHDGGRLFAANTPFSLGVFGGFALQPALDYEYDGRAPDQVIVVDERDIPKIEFIVTEQDEIFVFQAP